jgi:hypothetical protein
MEGTAAIQFNLEALRRILASMVAMAGLGDAALTSPQAPGTGGGRREASGSDAEETPTRQSGDCRPPLKGEVKPSFTLPRHLRLAILRLLRPAEAATRRLIIAAARGLTVTLPPARKPRPATMEPQLRRLGIAIVLPARILPRSRERGTGEAGGSAVGHRGALALCDPPRRFRPARSRAVPAHAAPRILMPGIAAPHRLPPPPSRDDPIDCTRIALRLAALAAALDDLPGQAKRFARWEALRQRRIQRAAPGSPSPSGGVVRGPGAAGRRRPLRLSPLRPGRPPGGRLARFDPSQKRKARIREVDEVLAHAHALALYALRPPDTS